MNLNLPTVSTTLGPEWASLLIAALNLIDSHDHSTDHGTKVTPSGMNINADLAFANFQASGLKTAKFSDQLAALASSFVGCVYLVGGDLYFNNGSGMAVQLTSGGSVNAPGSGILTTSATVTGNYTVVAGDAQKVIVVDTASVAITLTLPAATTAMHFVVKDKTGSAATNNITIAPNGLDTIEGAASSYTVDANFAAISLISDGSSNWAVI